MDAPTHYARAEALLREAKRISGPSVTATLAAAQVHATLALAGAVGLGAFGRQPADDADAWTTAAGVPVAGENLAPAPAEVEEAPKGAIDLMGALRASVERAKAARETGAAPPVAGKNLAPVEAVTPR